MRDSFRSWNLFRFFYVIILLCVMASYFIFRGLFVIYGLGNSFVLQWNFLTVSVLITVLAILNYLLSQRLDSEIGQRYTLWLLFAMFFGTLGDFLLAGVLPIPFDTFMLGVIFGFTIGHIFYLLALRQLSPLLIDPGFKSQPERASSSSRINYRNLIILVIFLIGCTIGFMVFLFNPTLLTLSIGGLFYFLLFSSVLAFALTKFFDAYPLQFKISLILGFILFYISDLVLVWNRFNTPLLFASLIISVTYLFGQLLVQVTPILKTNTEK